MPIEYDITEDIRYQQGLEEGVKRLVAQMEQKAMTMLRSPEFKRGAFDMNFISIILDLPLDRVWELKAEVEQEARNEA